MTNSVRDLHVGEMIGVSMHWLHPDTKPIFLSITELAPLFSRVEVIHTSLVAARDNETAETATQALSDQAADLDERHDYRARALYYLVLAAQYHELGKDTPDPARSDALEGALDALFPTRLQIVVASYQEQAGNSAQIEKLATNDYSDLLATVTIDDKTTAKTMAIDLGEAGRKLSVIEASRPKVAADAQETKIPRAEVRRRMRAWASLAETILGVLDQSSAPTAAVNSIRGPLLEAAEKATARRRAQRAAKKTNKTDPGK